MSSMQGVFQLKGVVLNYSWGGFDFIPHLLNQTNPDRKPFAEYWLGAHANFPSLTSEGPLDKLIASNSTGFLGKQVSRKFTTLPFLFKILDVRQMLSIQVHPGKKSAEKEFKREEMKGISRTAAERNYKDDNHKPELMVALGDFWLLHGFKNEKDLSKVMEQTKELRFLQPVFSANGYKGLYEAVMLMPQKNVNEHLEPLVKRIMPLYEKGTLKKDQEDFWAARAADTFCKNGQYDRGIFSIYFFNLLHLKKGEAVFQPEGMPHAYLEGQNAEVMANSDNVLRAGLTEKHVDVVELMKHVNFTPTLPQILKDSGGHSIYETSAEEFELHHYQLEEGEELKLHTRCPEIFFVMEGHVTGKDIDWKAGEGAFISSDTKCRLTAMSDISLYRVTVPLSKN